MLRVVCLGSSELRVRLVKKRFAPTGPPDAPSQPSEAARPGLVCRMASDMLWRHASCLGPHVVVVTRSAARRAMNSISLAGGGALLRRRTIYRRWGRLPCRVDGRTVRVRIAGVGGKECGGERRARVVVHDRVAARVGDVLLPYARDAPAPPPATEQARADKAADGEREKRGKTRLEQQRADVRVGTMRGRRVRRRWREGRR